MITLTRIEVGGMSSAGEFRGALNIEPGLQVISANNAFGKTLACSAITWCLALEPMFGIRDDDPIRFPVAVRESIDLEGAKGARVVSSYASVTFLRADGAQLRLSRDIVGDSKHVDVAESDDGENWRNSRLVARYRTMADETGGLQNFLFRWLSLPRRGLLTHRGEPTEVYLENIAPHFIIDQTEGWATIQALQVARYGQQDIAAASVEYLLGADDALKARLHIQAAETKQARLKMAAAELVQQVVEAFKRRGWPLDWSSHGTVDEIAARWSKKSLKETARKKFRFDLAAEQKTVNEKLQLLRRRLTQEGLDPKSATAASDASQAVIELKARRHELREQLRGARSHKIDQDRVAESLEHRILAAKDLVRLKKAGVGRLDAVECPTCHRDLEYASFGLVEQNPAAVAAHIEAMQRDRVLVRGNIASSLDQITRLSAELESVEEKLRGGERSLEIVNATAGHVREQLAKIATDISAAERELEKNLATSDELDRLQAELDKWIAEAREAVGEAPSPGDLDVRRDVFVNALRDYLVTLGHHGVTASEAEKVTLEDGYTPYLATRRLRSLGSASDHARLVMAFALSLAEASTAVAGYHPGLVVFDEPLQQNPDKPHRDLFVGFLQELAGEPLPYNVVIFTSLLAPEIAQLREAGVQVNTPTTAHFLSLLPPPPPPEPPKVDSPSDADES